MKTYTVIGIVGVGLFTLVVVCARGQTPKELEPSPILEGSVIAPQAPTYHESLLPAHGVGMHPVPGADLWATYCSERGCGPSLERDWHPLAVLCSLFKFPAWHDCGGDCTSCATKPGHGGRILDRWLGGGPSCHCPQCSGYAYHDAAPKQTEIDEPSPAPTPPQVPKEAEPPAITPPTVPAPVAAEPVDQEDPAPAPPPGLERLPAADAPQADQPQIPRNEIPAKETSRSSRRVKARFAGYRLSDYIQTN